jgi:hypothetical protein
MSKPSKINWRVVPASEIKLYCDDRSESLFAVDIYHTRPYEMYIGHLSAAGKVSVANANTYKIKRVYFARGKDSYLEIRTRGK